MILSDHCGVQLLEPVAHLICYHHDDVLLLGEVTQGFAELGELRSTVGEVARHCGAMFSSVVGGDRVEHDEPDIVFPDGVGKLEGEDMVLAFEILDWDGEDTGEGRSLVDG